METNVTAPAEGAKRGRRLLPRDTNGKMIRASKGENNIKFLFIKTLFHIFLLCLMKPFDWYPY